MGKKKIMEKNKATNLSDNEASAKTLRCPRWSHTPRRIRGGAIDPLQHPTNPPPILDRMKSVWITSCWKHDWILIVNIISSSLAREAFQFFREGQIQNLYMNNFFKKLNYSTIIYTFFFPISIAFNYRRIPFHRYEIYFLFITL